MLIWVLIWAHSILEPCPKGVALGPYISAPCLMCSGDMPTWQMRLVGRIAIPVILQRNQGAAPRKNYSRQSRFFSFLSLSRHIVEGIFAAGCLSYCSLERAPGGYLMTLAESANNIRNRHSLGKNQTTIHGVQVNTLVSRCFSGKMDPHVSPRM